MVAPEFYSHPAQESTTFLTWHIAICPSIHPSIQSPSCLPYHHLSPIFPSIHPAIHLMFPPSFSLLLFLSSIYLVSISIVSFFRPSLFQLIHILSLHTSIHHPSSHPPSNRPSFLSIHPVTHPSIHVPFHTFILLFNHPYFLLCFHYFIHSSSLSFFSSILLHLSCFSYSHLIFLSSVYSSIYSSLHLKSLSSILPFCFHHILSTPPCMYLSTHSFFYPPIPPYMFSLFYFHSFLFSFVHTSVLCSIHPHPPLSSPVHTPTK